VAFTQHDLSLGASTVAPTGASGGNQITSDMINLLYDIPLGDTWKFTVGGGLGIGGVRGALRTNGTSFDIFRGATSAINAAIGALKRLHQIRTLPLAKLAVSQNGL